MSVEFLVENAGCVSCGEIVRKALSELGDVHLIGIDEDADVASVSIESARPFTPEEVDRLLGQASDGSGHRYRVESRSWKVSR